MKQLGLLDFSPAPQSATMAPSARASRRSGRRAATQPWEREPSRAMCLYRDVLIRFGPMTDEQAAERLGWRPTSCCARRDDLNTWAREQIVAAVDRVPGIRVRTRMTSRVRWGWTGPR